VTARSRSRQDLDVRFRDDWLSFVEQPRSDHYWHRISAFDKFGKTDRQGSTSLIWGECNRLGADTSNVRRHDQFHLDAAVHFLPPRHTDADVHGCIRRIKSGDYAAIVGRDNQYRIVERPWQDLAEPSKLAILQDAVNWSGITNRDRAHILLAEIDPGRIQDAQRNRLIDMAEAKPSLRDILENTPMRSEAREQGRDIDQGMER
jgi:hypothetical protein